VAVGCGCGFTARTDTPAGLTLAHHSRARRPHCRVGHLSRAEKRGEKKAKGEEKRARTTTTTTSRRPHARQACKPGII
jgi:hypothetical protein